MNQARHGFWDGGDLVRQSTRLGGEERAGLVRRGITEEGAAALREGQHRLVLQHGAGQLDSPLYQSENFAELAFSVVFAHAQIGEAMPVGESSSATAVEGSTPSRRHAWR